MINIVFLTSFIVISFLYLDLPIINYLQEHQLSQKLHTLKYITLVGESSVYILCLPLIWGIHFIRNHKIKDIISEKILYIWSSLFICNLAALILKIILGRARPIMYILEQNYGFYWLQLDSNFWSMPSGHSITIFALFLSFWCLYSYYSRIFIVLAVLVAASRIFLMKHYLSDVLFAILIDVVLLYCINRMIYKKKYLPKLIKYIESKPIFLARFLFLK